MSRTDGCQWRREAVVFREVPSREAVSLLVPRLIRLHFPKVVAKVRGTERVVTNVTFVLRCAWNIVVGIFLKGVGQLTSAIVTRRADG